jgi:hypothetical protein
MKYLHSRGNERFTLHLRVSRSVDYFFICFGIGAIVVAFLDSGWSRYIWGASGLVAFLGSAISLVFLGVLRMGPKGIAAWHQWHWTWIAWDALAKADTRPAEGSRRRDQLVLHTTAERTHAFAGLETPRRVAALEGSVQWAADIINAVIAARLAKQSPPSG